MLFVEGGCLNVVSLALIKVTFKWYEMDDRKAIQNVAKQMVNTDWGSGRREYAQMLASSNAFYKF